MIGWRCLFLRQKSICQPLHQLSSIHKWPLWRYASSSSSSSSSSSIHEPAQQLHTTASSGDVAQLKEFLQRCVATGHDVEIMIQDVLDDFKKTSRYGLEVYNTLLYYCEDMSLSDRVQQAMRADQCYPGNATTLNILYKKVGMARDVEEAQRVLRRFSRESIDHDEHFPAIQMEVYGALQHFKDMEAILHGANHLRGREAVERMNVALEVYGKHGMHQKMAEIVREMKRREWVQSFGTFQALIQGYSEGQNIKKMEETLVSMAKEKHTPSRQIYNAFLHAYGHTRQWEKLHAMHQNMTKAGLAPTVATFNTMLQVYAKVHDLIQVESILAQMKSHGIRLNAISYQALILAYGNGKHTREVKRIQREMLEARVRPTLGVFNALLGAAQNGSDVAWMHSILEDMARSQVAWNVSTYSLLLRTYRTRGQLDKTHEYWDQLMSSALQPDAGCFMEMLTAYSEAGDMEGVDRIWTQMKEKGVVPTTNMHRNMMAVYAKAGKHNKVAEIQQEMQDAKQETSTLQQLSQLGRAGMKVDSGMFSELLLACTRKGDTDQVQMIWRDMCLAGTMPSASAIISVLCMYGDADMRAVFHQVSEDVIASRPVGLRIWKQMAKYLTKWKDDARLADLQKRMKKQGLHWDVELYNILLEAFAWRPDLDGTRRQLKTELKALSLKPNLGTFRAMVEPCLHRMVQGNEVLLVQLTKEMQEEGLPVGDFFHALFAGCFRDPLRLHGALGPLVNHVSSCGLALDVSTFTSVLVAYDTAKQGLLADRMWREMKGAAMGMDVEAFNAMLRTVRWLAPEVLVDRAKQIRVEMASNGIVPKTSTYLALLDVFVKVKALAEIEGLHQEVEGLGDIDASMLTGLVAAYAQLQQFEKVASLHQKMRCMRTRPTAGTYKVLAETYEVARDMGAMESIWDEMMSLGIKPGLAVYNTYLRAYTHAIHIAMKNGPERQESSNPSPKESDSVEGMRSRMEALWEHMTQHRVTPNSEGVECMERMYQMAGDKQKIQWLKKERKRFGLKPSIKNFSQLLGSKGPGAGPALAC